AVSFSGVTVPIVAGEEFDFTHFLPSGTHQFSIVNLNPEYLADPALPPLFLHSFRFKEEGLAVISTTAIVVSEPVGIGSAWLGFALLFGSHKRPARAQKSPPRGRVS